MYIQRRLCAAWEQAAVANARQICDDIVRLRRKHAVATVGVTSLGTCQTGQQQCYSAAFDGHACHHDDPEINAACNVDAGKRKVV